MTTTAQTLEKSGFDLLRRSLQANGIFSELCGLTALIGGTTLGNYLGIDHITMGISLLIFGIGVLFVSMKAEINEKAVYAIIILDVLWVISVVPQILSASSPLTTEGKWVMGIASVAVADFAFLQFWGLKRKSI